LNLAEGLAVGHQDKILIFGGIATHPDMDKMTSASCSHMREDNGKDMVVSNSSSPSSDNEKTSESDDDLHHQKLIWKLNGNSSKNDTNSSLSYFSRNILTISLNDEVKNN
jgi:hypothetical protein